MAGYRPWMSGAVAAAKRANAAQAARHRAGQYEEYCSYAAEQRACGYEVESFEEWLGEVDPREAAEERVMHGFPYSQFNYYADMF